jgi:NADH dehydrogenase FAD-containing subunit
MAKQMQTPRDVLERTYRRAIEQADALGISLADLMPQILPSTREELREYAREEYGIIL